ncbi:helix-turn-helix domain-containing protein [Rhizobium phaseoli]|uniref:helix-turn-helix domain-containing protein n=1 Tax=Rhizobium phaseoli TaxID=396 RepID=UPI0001904FEF|nr:helix-turn-helix domain-containing protein [Rhizobium phaseoli]MDK4727060.1 helix-turn-helix domain-containing protein [Rhizobium phaseoli]NKE89095.1 helix-turn-helix domain-containing protein [Rhizobium phaseoli]PDS70554.1 helix-turn-helix domain-containing protein [Rhizobium phaseoli]
MITATQIRGARAMIGMSIEELAAASGLPVETVAALEKGEFAGEPHALFDVRSTLEAQGIIFLSSGNQDEGGPGIRLRARTSSGDGIRPENLNAANDD